MTNSEMIVSIILILVLAAVAVGIRKLILKKSILFKIVAAMMIPLANCLIVGLFVGVKGFSYFWWGALYAVIIMTLGFELVGKMVKKPLGEMIKVIESLSKGDVEVSFDEKLQKGGHELAQVVRLLVKLTESLRNVSTFANHVGKGNLNVEYTLLSENDSLGKSLLEMRHSLQNAEKAQILRAKEEEQRSWVTSGLAKFSEILRHDTNNMEALSYNVISNMVKYLGINQGGIFVKHEEDNVLEMKACYAYDRKKYAEKKIIPGEGLVGTCYLEGEPIYMTEVPNQYINITSGLGNANPKAILICPLKVNDQIFGVIELASFQPFEPHQLDFVQKVSESIASTISTVNVNIRTGRLLSQTKLQAEEMASQEEELRQNMEEMQATQEEMRRREDELLETLAKLQKKQASIEQNE